jgi:uncharacterized protein YlxW (UPF0749 family)
MTAVAMLLGLLIVLQIRAQSGGTGLATLSAQELTVLVANLNTRNDQLRTEIATLDQEARSLQDSQARGETSVGQLQVDLARVRAWAGLSAVTGQGVRITVSGSIAGSAVDDLLNELRNAGAEAIAVAGIRVVSGTVVSGPPGALTVENRALGDPFEVSAIGNSETLTGSLTRAGGIVAQLAATFPDAQLTVTPVAGVQLAATLRGLQPVHGAPKL